LTLSDSIGAPPLNGFESSGHSAEGKWFFLFVHLLNVGYKYAYHYMREGRMVFRYDNASDITARELRTYPHHKHVGETIEESHAPTLREVLEEIARHLT